MRRGWRGSLGPTSLLIGPVLAAALLCSHAQTQETDCKDAFCWEVYSPTPGERVIKITQWPRSTHRNIRWECQAGGCQVEGNVLHLHAGVGGSTQIAVQACTRHRLRRPTCSAWTSFAVH